MWVSRTWQGAPSACTRAPFPSWSVGLAGGASTPRPARLPLPPAARFVFGAPRARRAGRVPWGIPRPHPPERWGAAHRAQTSCPDTGDNRVLVLGAPPCRRWRTGARRPRPALTDGPLPSPKGPFSAPHVALLLGPTQGAGTSQAVPLEFAAPWNSWGQAFFWPLLERTCSFICLKSKAFGIRL